MIVLILTFRLKKKKKNSIRLIRVQLASNEHLRKNDPIVTIYEI